MKNIIIMLIMCSAVFYAGAQVSFTGTTANPTKAILNATTDTVNLTMAGDYAAIMTVQALVTKTSGTMAGTVRLYGSNYANTTGAWEPVGDTLTLSNAATNKHTWTVSQPGYKYYQLLQSGGTTVAGILNAKAMVLKPR